MHVTKSKYDIGTSVNLQVHNSLSVRSQLFKLILNVQFISTADNYSLLKKILLIKFMERFSDLVLPHFLYVELCLIATLLRARRVTPAPTS